MSGTSLREKEDLMALPTPAILDWEVAEGCLVGGMQVLSLRLRRIEPVGAEGEREGLGGERRETGWEGLVMTSTMDYVLP